MFRRVILFAWEKAKMMETEVIPGSLFAFSISLAGSKISCKEMSVHFACRWFEQGTNPFTRQEDWLYSGGYWDRNFDKTIDIFWWSSGPHLSRQTPSVYSPQRELVLTGSLPAFTSSRSPKKWSQRIYHWGVIFPILILYFCRDVMLCWAFTTEMSCAASFYLLSRVGNWWIWSCGQELAVLRLKSVVATAEETDVELILMPVSVSERSLFWVRLEKSCLYFVVNEVLLNALSQ